MSSVEPADAPIHVDDAAHFEALTDADGVVLVDFYADWCGPCKMLAPTVEELATETDATVAKVDIDELQGVASAEGVRSVPTLQFYADGERVEELVGVREKSELAGIVADHA
ncbi:MAG: thioredoxin [Halolamina sp.]